MENNDVLESQWDNKPENFKDKRGMFLLVICILSWAFMGFSILSTAVTYFNGTEKLEEQLIVTQEAFTDQETGNAFLDNMMIEAQEIMVKTIENFKEIQIGTIVALLFGAMSVYLMFSLKKIGFYLYVIYSMLVPGISIYYLGSSMVIIAAVAFGALFGIAFIIMYGVNLKRMTE